MKILVHMCILLAFSSCNDQSQVKNRDQAKEFKMTVFFHDNQNPNSEWTKKALVKDSIINFRTALIDIYFISKISHVPYYLPTNGIFKDSIKDKECNWAIYPENVKCYQYDSIGRVSNMNINGSGIMGVWNYKYDEQNRIVEIREFVDIYSVKYDPENGYLTELKYVNNGEFKSKFR